MKAHLLLSCILMTLTLNIFAQEEQWEPQKQITGYISTQAEYIPDLKYSDMNYGASLSEAGLLINYMPLKKLAIKSVFVYRPMYTVDQMVNELSAEWQLRNTKSDFLKIKTGRFLTPLSPINTNFFAPVNVGITLPIMMAHHELYPLNIDGICLSGGAGQTYKFSYNIFGGGYKNSLSLTTGALGFFGNEDKYLPRTNGINSNFNLDSLNSQISFGGGSHVGFEYNDMFEVGLNYFTNAKDEIHVDIPIPNFGTIQDTLNLSTIAYGINFKFHYKGLQLNAEQWWCNAKVSDGKFVPDTSAISSGGYYELMYTIGKFTPYVKYETHNIDFFDFMQLDYNRYTVGLNFKPSYELTLKAEYVHYDYTKPLDAALVSIIYSF